MGFFSVPLALLCGLYAASVVGSTWPFLPALNYWDNGYVTGEYQFSTPFTEHDISFNVSVKVPRNDGRKDHVKIAKVTTHSHLGRIVVHEFMFHGNPLQQKETASSVIAKSYRKHNFAPRKELLSVAFSEAMIRKFDPYLWSRCQKVLETIVMYPVFHVASPTYYEETKVLQGDETGKGVNPPTRDSETWRLVAQGRLFDLVVDIIRFPGKFVKRLVSIEYGHLNGLAKDIFVEYKMELAKDDQGRPLLRE